MGLATESGPGAALTEESEARAGSGFGLLDFLS